MSFLGKPELSGAVITWDGTKFVADTLSTNISLQNAYDNGYQIQVTSSKPFTLTGSNSSSGPVFEIIHSSNQSTDEGIKFTTEAVAPASDWKPIAAYDKNGLKVFEIETDTNNSIVAVRSPVTDGNSGFQFLNQIGTYIALDTVSSPTILRIQKSSNGYIDFAANGITDPVMRVFADSTNGTISSSVYITSSLLVSGTIKANAISGSLTRLSNNIPYVISGPNITIATNSLGQIEITGSGGGGGGDAYWQSDVNNIIYTTGSAGITGSVTLATEGTGRGLLNFGGLDIGVITGSAITTTASPMTSLGGNLISSSYGVGSGVTATVLYYNLYITGISQAAGNTQAIAATYLVMSTIDNGLGILTVRDVTELSRKTVGGYASGWDINFDPDGTIGVTGSVDTYFQNVYWYGQLTKEMSIDSNGNRS
jgi:hypothetical protein